MAIVLATACPVLGQTVDRVARERAAKIAAEFVTQNGYASEARPDAIESLAVIARPRTVKGRSFWSVLFRFRRQPIKRNYDFGREIRVSMDGTRVWLGANSIRVWRHSIPL